MNVNSSEAFIAEYEKLFPESEILSLINDTNQSGNDLYFLWKLSTLEKIYCAAYIRYFTLIPQTSWGVKHLLNEIIRDFDKLDKNFIEYLKLLPLVGITTSKLLMGLYNTTLKRIKDLNIDFIDEYQFKWYTAMLHPGLCGYFNHTTESEYYINEIFPILKDIRFLDWLYEKRIYKLKSCFLTEKARKHLYDIIPDDGSQSCLYYKTYAAIINRNFPEVMKKLHFFDEEYLSALITTIEEYRFKSTSNKFFEMLLDIYYNKSLNTTAKRTLRRIIIRFGKKADTFLIREYFSIDNRQERYEIFSRYLSKRKNPDFLEKIESFLRGHPFNISFDNFYYDVATVLIDIYSKMGSEAGAENPSKPSEFILGFYGVARLLSNEDFRKLTYKRLIDLGANENL